MEKKQNAYLYCRECRGINRDKASEMGMISYDRLGDIENGKRATEPDDVAKIMNYYEMPRLGRYYCAHECVLGKELGYPSIDLEKREDLAQIALGILRRLDEITKIDTKTLIRITEDGIISPEEEADFNELKKRLEPIAKIYDSLRLWEMERDGEQRWKKKKDNDNIDD